MPTNAAQITKWRAALPLPHEFFLPRAAHRPPVCAVCDTSNTDATVDDLNAGLIAEVEVTPAIDGTHACDEKAFTHLINDSTFPLCASCASVSKASVIDVTGADRPWQFVELTPLEVLLITSRFHTATEFTVSTTGAVTLRARALRNDCAGVFKVTHLPLNFLVLRRIARVVCADGAPIPNGHYLRNLSTFFVRRELVASSIVWLKLNNHAYRNIEIDWNALAMLPVNGLYPHVVDLDDIAPTAEPRLNTISVLLNDDGVVAFAECFPTLFPKGYNPVTRGWRDEVFFISEWTRAVGLLLCVRTPGYIEMFHGFIECVERQRAPNTEDS